MRWKRRLKRILKGLGMKFKSAGMIRKKKSADDIYNRIREIIEKARGNVARTINTEMLVAYWHIGREIVVEEQRGKLRAGYGEALLKRLSERLNTDFGRGFDESNLRNIRQFYLSYPKCDALRHELSWTHYRLCYAQHNRYYVGLALMLASLPPLTALFSFYTT